MSRDEKRKLHNRWHRRIPVSEVQPGDFIQIYERGQRWRKVASITKKGRFRTAPSKYRGCTLYKAKIVHPSKVLSAWTKRKN